MFIVTATLYKNTTNNTTNNYETTTTNNNHNNDNNNDDDNNDNGNSSFEYACRPCRAATRVRQKAARDAGTPSPPTKNSDFRGFDSSKLLILRDGNSHVR